MISGMHFISLYDIMHLIHFGTMFCLYHFADCKTGHEVVISHI